ncbi:MAG TPA: hypothetical protein VG407_13030 [Caulobacteraceae bacterium]|nr:hypothetical protein [Caulobacteraceae bacterium]
MSKARLTLVPPEAGSAPETAPETAADRIRRLQAEAQGLAREQIEQLHVAMTGVARQAEEIAVGGEAYPVGARELARRLVDEINQRAGILQAILSKV